MTCRYAYYAYIIYVHYILVGSEFGSVVLHIIIHTLTETRSYYNCYLTTNVCDHALHVHYYNYYYYTVYTGCPSAFVPVIFSEFRTRFSFILGFRLGTWDIWEVLLQEILLASLDGRIRSRCRNKLAGTRQWIRHDLISS